MDDLPFRHSESAADSSSSQFSPSQFFCEDEQETVRWAEKLAQVSEAGLVIALDGTLGAGKTRFVRAFAAALGVPEETVNSPTYVIVQHYPGKFLLHHFDLYRLKDEDEWYELGAEELLESSGVSLIEWASRFENLLPEDRISLQIESHGPTARSFRVHWQGELAEKVARNWLNLSQ